ncbi:MAG: NAD(P)-dependent glycerol-3-phosphate dehydrogenase [Lachnospiraceae bacterium]|jgi:glycerol-3-phosphate dehydrogenase (NAD(P)+)|nr:NAD(P)-dependent glycerol-3-phosphate dehydrogenase [Lachnospiraceae bacterium]
MARVSILGSGSYGTALALLLHKNGHEVILWSSTEEKAATLERTRRNPVLPDVEIPSAILVTPDLHWACGGSAPDLIVLAASSIHIRTLARASASSVRKGQIVVNVAKGIEEESLKTLSRQIEEELPQAQVAVLSGPSHAEEVGRGIPTTCVAAAHCRQVAETVQNLFMCDSFRVYTNPDVVGVEIGGALKNVIALAAGIADGLGYGDNTKAALITRGMAEITRLALAMGARTETLYGLSGIGDLVVTCASMHSRNRRAGILIGQGLSAKEAMKEVNMVVEGVYAAKAGLALSRRFHVAMPITESINEVLFDGKSPADCLRDLMLRDRCVENANLCWEGRPQ